MAQQTMEISTINPATEEILSNYEEMSKAKVESIVEKAKTAFSWWNLEYEKRRGCVYNLAEYLKKNKTELGKIATKEMGKVLKESISEVEKCAWVLEFYADHAKSFLSEEVLNTDARKSFITFEPLGIIGSIMPWNFPYWQCLRFAAPCLMAGNTIFMKPSRITTQIGIDLEKSCT